MKKKLLIALACLLAIAGVFCAIYFPNSSLNNTIAETQDTVIQEIQEIEQIEQAENEVIVTNETKTLVEETAEAIENNEDISTTETLESTEEEEQLLEEENLEPDAQVEQENIAWEGDNTGNGLSLLGEYQGLTYYNQADSRWANMMYSSIGNPSQTMKSSACRTYCCCYCCF